MSVTHRHTRGPSARSDATNGETAPNPTDLLIPQQSGLAKANRSRNLLLMYNKGLTQATGGPLELVNFLLGATLVPKPRVEIGRFCP
jgi:hypothetical protein